MQKPHTGVILPALDQSPIEKQQIVFEKMRKSADNVTVSDFSIFESKIKESHESFEIMCKNIENLVENNIKSIEENKQINNNQNIEFKQQKEELIQKNEEISQTHLKNEKMKEAALKLRKKFDDAITKLKNYRPNSDE